MLSSEQCDVVIVGTRVAGAVTAMLLAREGLRVLAVDRTHFPSDTVSSHQVQVSGAARLHRWGLLEGLEKAGVPATRTIRYDQGHAVLDGVFPGFGGVDALYSPRRTVLDSMLVDAAGAAGAELRQDYRVEGLLREDGRVVGIRGRGRGGAPTTVRAPLVVGADGKRSSVAEWVGARSYGGRPVATFACYGYWEGLGLTGGELYQRHGRAVAAFPTNDGLDVVFMSGPAAEFDRFRADIPGNYLATLDRCADLGARARDARRVERLRTTPDLPHTYRVPCGPGWALVGDAGLTMDPVSAMGISNALRDAEFLAEAVVAGFGHPGALDQRLAHYWRQRDAAAEPVFDFTTELARLSAPSPEGGVLVKSLAGREDEMKRFFGVFAGVTPFDTYFSLGNLLPLLGVRGLAGIVGARLGWAARALRPRGRSRAGGR